MAHNLYRKEFILHRHESNPLIMPKNFDCDFIVDAIFNCGQTVYNDEILLLLPVQPTSGTPAMHVATSKDGVYFNIRKEPFITALKNQRDIGEFDIWPIDPRISKIDDTYYIVRPIESTIGTAAILEKTRDWQEREYLGCIAMPSNRVPCIFPEKINGMYCRLDRPYNGNRGDIWISYSPDLLHWGNHKQLLASPVNNTWAKEKIGPCVPVKTSAGWLEIFHGVLTFAGGARYCLGAMLLDYENPEKIIGMTNGWILCPDAEYEFMGNCQNTVFATGCIVDEENDKISIYYGAADTTICLTTGSLNELLKACLDT